MRGRERERIGEVPKIVHKRENTLVEQPQRAAERGTEKLAETIDERKRSREPGADLPRPENGDPGADPGGGDVSRMGGSAASTSPPCLSSPAGSAISSFILTFLKSFILPAAQPLSFTAFLG